MLLNTDIFVKALGGKKLDDCNLTDLYNRLDASLFSSLVRSDYDYLNVDIEKIESEDIHERRIEVVINEERLEIYRFEEEGLTVDLSLVDSHGYGNKQIILPKYYKEGKEMENMIINSPDVVKSQMADELNASDEYSNENPIHFHLDKMEWENSDVELNDLDFYLSKESLSELFNDEDDLVIGRFTIDLFEDKVIMSSDKLKVVDEVEGNTYFYGFKISMSRKMYKDIEKELMI